MPDTKRPPLNPLERPPAQTARMGATLRPGPIGAGPGFVPPPPSTPRLSSSPPPPPRPRASAPRVTKDVELVVVEESQLPSADKKPWRAAEVWTKRRVYGLDSTFRCVEILDRETGRPDPGHELVGARLGGGRSRDKDVVRFSYPLPLPGMEAMFLKGNKHGYTSVVERMIVRVRVLTTAADEAMPTWDDIASRWSDPPPPK